MKKIGIPILAFAVGLIMMVGVIAQGPGQGQGPGFERGNWLSGIAEPLNVTEVLQQTYTPPSEPTIANDTGGPFGHPDTHVLSIDVQANTTLDDIFAGAGFSYTYEILEGGLFNGSAPLVATFELDDGRHVVLFPGWGDRTGEHTLTYSDTVAEDTGGNNAVDFTVYTSDFEGGAQWSSGGTYPPWTDTKELDGAVVDGTEEVVNAYFMTQGAGSGQVDELISYVFMGETISGEQSLGEEFDFYRVTFEEVEYDTWVYREPPRLGGHNFVLELESSTTDNRFWFSVSAPDEDGIQHEIVHVGEINIYYILGGADMEDVRSLTALFDDEGNLLNVNGVEPVIE